MVELGESERNGVVSCLRYEGRDERGWHILAVSPQSHLGAEEGGPLKIFNITMQGKTLELVQQKEEMRVYVNPDPTGFDEWAIGSERIPVQSPQPQSRGSHSHIATHGG